LSIHAQAVPELRAEDLQAEELRRLSRLNRQARPEVAQVQARAEARRRAPAPTEEPWEVRLSRVIAAQEVTIRAKASEVKTAAVALRRAEAAYHQGEGGPSRDAHLQALLAAQERHRQAVDGLREVEHAAPLVIAREVAASWRLPWWLAVVGVVGLLLVAGPLLLGVLALVVGLPLLAFAGALRC